MVGLALALTISAASPTCADVPRALAAAALELDAPERLWRVSRLARRDVVPGLFERFSKARGAAAISLGAALGLGRHAAALRALSEVRPATPEGRLGRALGLLALGDASATATITAALEQSGAGVRRLVARALAEMLATRPRVLSYALLKDDDPAVRLAVAEPHLRRGSRRARAVLLDLLDAPEHRARAARILIDAGHRFSRSDLERLPAFFRRRAVVEGSGTPESLLTSADPELRAGAFAAAVAEADLRPRRLRVAARQNRRRDPERAEAELAMARVLSGLAGRGALAELSEVGLAAATAVLSAYAATEAGGVGPRALDALEATLRAWRGAPADEAAFLRALSRLDPLRALSLGRARLTAEPAPLVEAALVAVGRAGRATDLPALLERAERGPPGLRVAALEAAHQICAR